MFTIKALDAAALDHYHADLMALLADVVNSGASVNFIAPLAESVALDFWQRVRAELHDNKRVVLAAITHDQARPQVVGCVHLAFAAQPNGSHRAELQKLLVHSQHRQKGIGSALMQTAEVAARAHGKTLLVLDTERDSTADALYQKWGYTPAGVIPRYAMNSSGTQLIDAVFYYKLL